jgi:hypothetical protein
MSSRLSGQNFILALSLLCAFGCRRTLGVREANELAWRTLAEASKPTQAEGATENDTRLSWRLWWNAEEIYVNPNKSEPPTQSKRGTFESLRCKQESELQLLDPTVPQPDPCEEIWLNGSAENYVVGNGLWNRSGLRRKASEARIEFPGPQRPLAVEMKTEWWDPTNVAKGTYVMADTVKGKRFLVAFHMMIHAQTDWVWATFIHESLTYMVTDAGATLDDSFGADNGKPSGKLKALLHDNDVEILRHYRLIGTQVGMQEPKLLGNPIIERGLVKQQMSSCISCHRFASITQAGQVAPGAGGVGGEPPIPNQYNPLNFSFSLAVRPICKSGDGGCAN